MSHIDTPWSRLASRTARGLLARKGATYHDVALALHEIGIEETPKSVELKIQRGSYKCAFFLQLLCALRADMPAELERVLDGRTDWDDACRRLALGVLAGHSMSIEKLPERLRQCGVHTTSMQVESQTNSGTFPFTLILQLAYLQPLQGLERFVDRSDLAKAASESSRAASQPR